MRTQRYLMPVTITLVLLAVAGIACRNLRSNEVPTPIPVTHVYSHGTLVAGGDGEPIELLNNPAATNPTYAELLAFIKKDQTDKYSYIFWSSQSRIYLW